MSSLITFQGSVTFESNLVYLSSFTYGGGMALVESEVLFRDPADFQGNTAFVGGGISAIQDSKVNSTAPITLARNNATFGGALYLANSTMELLSTSSLTGNVAFSSGSMLLAFTSTVLFSGSNSNMVVGYGGIYANSSDIQG